MASLKEKYGPNTGVTQNNGKSKPAPSFMDRLSEGVSDAMHNVKTFARNVDSSVDKNTYAGGEKSGGYKKVFTHGE